MKYGYIKVVAVSPEIQVANTIFNTERIVESIAIADKKGAEIILFPELSLTGATCGDLFFSLPLLDGAMNGLKNILNASKGVKAIIFIGMPLKKGGVIYNVAVAVCDGKVLGVVPKSVLYSHGVYTDARYFAPCPFDNDSVEIFGQTVAFGSKILFSDINNKSFTVGVEIGSDLLSPLAPSNYHAVNGANIIVNLCSTPETVGKEDYKKSVVSAQSEKLTCGYILADSGKGESTTDCVYGGQNIVCECGKVLALSKVFENSITESEIDVGLIEFERSKKFSQEMRADGYEIVTFDANRDTISLTREYEKTPFVPTNQEKKAQRAEFILSLQAEGLAKRIAHAHAGSAVLGLSGGLDSTLAILVAVTAMKKLNRPLKDVCAVTMPCFGTTSRTFDNTIKLAKALGVTLKKVDIGKAVTRHLKDIGHPLDLYDVTFENAQARERTQVLMDIANMNNGLVVGTGDLSEVALGWATYNGDHMSMYGVNCTVPKTLVRHVVESYAKNSKGKLKAVLLDILDTPVSPELLPAENGDISQKTEDIVGPYILHDFYLYNMIRRGYDPQKIYYIACKTFKGDFREETILKWLKTFMRRFFIQQFKRSCVPDGVKVGAVGLSPRGDWKMPSDAVSKLWLDSLENL